jgi:hypothetical protein
MWRRAFAKKNEEKMFEFLEKIGDHPNKQAVFQTLQELSHFGLCRAHAINLGRLIWALAYQKAHNPEQFWRAALRHCQGSYARWVYWHESKLAGAVPALLEGNEVNDMITTGVWSSPRFMPACTESRRPGQIEFCGLVANYRVFKSAPRQYVTFVTVGTGNGRYLDVIVPHAVSFHDHPVLWGLGKLDYKNNSEYVKIWKHKRLKLQDISHLS